MSVAVLSAPAARVSAVSPRPFLAPSLPPPGVKAAPKAVEALLAAFPSPGSLVRVSCADGHVSGTVVSVCSELVVLKQGAGFWHLPTESVYGVQTLPLPVRCELSDGELERAEARQRQREAERLSRLLDRWP